MVMDKFGDIIEVDDGGIYKLAGAGTSQQSWTSLNGNLRLMEFNSVASSNGKILGGAQDNGVTIQTAAGALVWTRLMGGDGQIVRAAGGKQLYSRQNLSGFTIDGNAPDLDVIGTGKKLNAVDPIRFDEPFVLNAVDSNRMLIGNSRLFESVDVLTANMGDLLIPLGSGNGAVLGHINPNAMVYGGWEGLATPKADIGWIGTNGDLLLAPVRRLLAEWLSYPPKVEVSTLGDAAVLSGALAVGRRAALDNVFTRRPSAAAV